jgi:hypothetical protein
MPIAIDSDGAQLQNLLPPGFQLRLVFAIHHCCCCYYCCSQRVSPRHPSACSSIYTRHPPGTSAAQYWPKTVVGDPRWTLGDTSGTKLCTPSWCIHSASSCRPLCWCLCDPDQLCSALLSRLSHSRTMTRTPITNASRINTIRGERKTEIRGH